MTFAATVTLLLPTDFAKNANVWATRLPLAEVAGYAEPS